MTAGAFSESRRLSMLAVFTHGQLCSIADSLFRVEHCQKKARRLSITLYDHRGSEGRNLDTFISAYIGIPRPANNLEEEATARNKLTYSNSPSIGDLGCD